MDAGIDKTSNYNSQNLNQLHQYFTDTLLEWYAESSRPMPWKGVKDPYAIWLSEIILQQTRVEQGLPYFTKFLEHFPTVFDLANASEDEVMKMWEGLGYYSRARNLHYTAKFIANELEGKFPFTYKEILNLKGVGPYTAAAIASFAFNLPHAVLDGNVFRVLSRFFGISTPIDTTEGKKYFSSLAQILLKKEEPAQYNQAIMDFGATQCIPKSPICQSCALQEKCRAFLESKVQQLPIKSKKIKKKTRYFHYLVINTNEKVFIRKREQKDIWKKLYEFPLLELPFPSRDINDFNDYKDWQALQQLGNLELERISKPYQQMLTHQKIIANFFEFKLKNVVSDHHDTLSLIERKNLSTFAFPKLIDCYLKDKSLYLNL